METNAASVQAAFHHALSCIEDTRKIVFQTSKQIIVTGGQVITVCKVILLYEAGVTKSLLGNRRLVDWTAVPDLWQGTWGSLAGPAYRGPSHNKLQMLLSFSSTQRITFP